MEREYQHSSYTKIEGRKNCAPSSDQSMDTAASPSYPWNQSDQFLHTI